MASDGIARDNWFGRVYDLDEDHGISGLYCVTDMEYALELVSAPTPTKYQVSCVPQGTAGSLVIPLNTLDDGEVFSVVIDDGPAEMEFRKVALGGCCDADHQDLAIFSITADCVELGTCGGYWPGSDTLGHIRAPYLAAPDCGIVDPIELPYTGFPYMHLIQVVNGDCDGDSGGAGAVPAGNRLGALLVVLVLLASSAYFLRPWAD